MPKFFHPHYHNNKGGAIGQLLLFLNFGQILCWLMNNFDKKAISLEVEVILLYTFIFFRYGERRSSATSPGRGRGPVTASWQMVVETVPLVDWVCQN